MSPLAEIISNSFLKISEMSKDQLLKSAVLPEGESYPNSIDLPITNLCQRTNLQQTIIMNLCHRANLHLQLFLKGYFS